jgi:hypothetical protein
MDKFDLPESLTDLDLDALNALADQGVAAYQALGLTEDSDEATVTEAERIVAAIRAVRAEVTRRADVKANASALIAEMATTDDAPEVDAADEAPVVEDVAEAEVEVTVEPTVEDVAEVVAEAEAVTESAPEAVTAAAEHPAAVAAQHAPAPLLPKEKNVNISLTAAADVPGFATGATLDSLDDIATGVVARMKGFPTGRPQGEVFNRYGTAMVTKTGFDGLSQDNPDYRDDEALLAAAVAQSRLPGGSLLAAGGWCAPSETIYDLCGEESASDLLSLPEVNVTRGGIRFTKGPDFSDIFTNVGFAQTETEAIAGTPDKTCYEVECPTFEEERLDAVGICIKAPILTNAAYPELVRSVIAKSLVAHEMKVNARVLAAIKTGLGAALTPADQGSTVSTLESLAWVAEGIRRKYGFSDAKTIEVVAPKWLKVSIREDLARRQGNTAASVTDAQINAWFSERNLAVQFVIGLDDLTGPVVKPPATASVLMYPAGSFIKGTSAVISLDSVYDSTGLVKNVYTALFLEEGVLVANKCYGGALVTIPVCDSGRSGAADLVACFGTAEDAAP